MPMDEPCVVITMSENPAMLACPANDGPDTIVMVGTQPDRLGHAIEHSVGARWRRRARCGRARHGDAAHGCPPPSTNATKRPSLRFGQRKQASETGSAVASAMVGEISGGHDGGPAVDGADRIQPARFGPPTGWLVIRHRGQRQRWSRKALRCPDPSTTRDVHGQ